MDLSQLVAHADMDAVSSEGATRQNELYDRAITAFGGALARLAAAYEANHAHREDLLQDIHVALWRSFSIFNDQCSLRTWVYRVAHNTAATHALRHKRSRSAQLVGLEELDDRDDGVDCERLADETAVLAKLNALVQGLKAIDRDVLLLYLEGMEPAEIAEIVGLSPNTVAQKIHRTKKVLRRYF